MTDVADVYSAVGAYAGISAVISVVISIVTIVAQWRLFEKAGKEGWLCLIPFVNVWVMHEIIFGSGAKMFLFLIPLYNIYFMFKYNIELAKRFGKPGVFGLGLLTLPGVFMPILAFSKDSEYQAIG